MPKNSRCCIDAAIMPRKGPERHYRTIISSLFNQCFEVKKIMKKSLFVILLLALAVGTTYSILPRVASRLIPTTNAAADTLALMPDSDFVALIDVGQLLSTKLFTSLSSDSKSSEQFKKFEQDALKYGIDIRQLNQIVLGGRSLSNGKEGDFYAIVTGSFDREKLLSSIASQPEKVTMQSESYGDKTIYILIPKNGAKMAKPDTSNFGQLPINYKGDKLALAFLNPGTLVVGNPEGVKTTLDVQTGKQPSLRNNQELISYITGLSAGSMIRFAGVEPTRKSKPEAAKPGQKPKVITNEQLDSGQGSTSASSSGDESDPGNFDQMVKSIRGGFGSIDLSTGFILDTTLLIRTESDAKKMYDSLNGLLSLGKMAVGGGQNDAKSAKLLEAINQVNLTGTGKDVKISINLSEQLIKDLLAVLESSQKKSTTK
jgi:hypothetical protein